MGEEGKWKQEGEGPAGRPMEGVGRGEAASLSNSGGRGMRGMGDTGGKGDTRDAHTRGIRREGGDMSPKKPSSTKSPPARHC